ncbi:unnamed protein product [Nippostrongylus brasiliensis]|uniref:Peptidase A1 domain-containing protein n=1 Tax=Nippostrongylus brasiliensis TaxID=27835 RepID=A0A0N4XTD0_NIPBR|nr:unnamed protein product [Nippostrongylus brasiliensis]
MRSALFICWILLGCAVDVNAYRLALTRISNQDKINMDQWKYRLDKSDPQPVYRAKDKDYYKTEITIGTPEQKFQGVGGMLGLGLKEQAKSPFYPPFQRAIDLKLAEPFFTVYLNREAGYITYGEVDDEHCGKEMGSASLVSSKDYAIKVDAIAVGNTTFNTGWSFHLDMEGIAIVMPKAIADAIPYEDGREYAFECDAACELTITINGIDYSLHVQDLSEPRYLNHCLLKIRGTDKSAEWMIGSGFMRRYCHIYDVEKKQVRFAPAVPQAELSSTTEQPGKLD